MKNIKELWSQYREVIMYLIFGGLTTLINLITFAIIKQIVPNDFTSQNVCISWFVSVLFAFVTNKIWVFQSKTNGIKAYLSEAFKFFSARFGTLLFELAFMFIFVTVLHQNESLFKLIAQVIIIVLNYILSKLLVFKNN